MVVSTLLRWPARRFEVTEGFLAGEGAEAADLANVAIVARRFSRTCLLLPLHAWRYRRRTMPIARGLGALLIATGFYDEAARMLTNPFVFMLIRPGDGRWVEILKPTIDHSGLSSVRRLRVLLWLVKGRSVIAATLWRRAVLRGGGGAPVDFETLLAATDIPATAFPYVLETEARHLPDGVAGPRR